MALLPRQSAGRDLCTRYCLWGWGVRPHTPRPSNPVLLHIMGEHRRLAQSLPHHSRVLTILTNKHTFKFQILFCLVVHKPAHFFLTTVITNSSKMSLKWIWTHFAGNRQWPGPTFDLPALGPLQACGVRMGYWPNHLTGQVSEHRRTRRMQMKGTDALQGTGC